MDEIVKHLSKIVVFPYRDSHYYTIFASEINLNNEKDEKKHMDLHTKYCFHG